MTERRVLVLFAHPSLERSEVGARRLAAARAHGGVTVVDLYAEYPDYRIDIDAEQRRLCEHDVLMFLFPLFWYSTPAIFKEWQDLVLEHGFAYGSEGHALAGKYFIASCSTGGPAAAYTEAGYNRFTLRELLRPLEQTAALCRMRVLPPFALFGARTALAEGRVEAHLRDFRQLLDRLIHDPLDGWEDAGVATANDLLPSQHEGSRA